MKKIIFVRHGRAEDQSSEISDFERSLTTRGKVISKQMAKRFREEEINPGQFITSPAFRALETAFIFAAEFNIRYDVIMVDSDLYFKADLKHLFAILEKVGDKTDTVTLFGHNPSFTEMPDRLCTEGCEFLTKTSIACLTFPVSLWSEIKTSTGSMEYFLKPEKQ
jgi:phosphohistidine phosphatase